jgi:hypothetical protein
MLEVKMAGENQFQTQIVAILCYMTGNRCTLDTWSGHVCAACRCCLSLVFELTVIRSRTIRIISLSENSLRRAESSSRVDSWANFHILYKHIVSSYYLLLVFGMALHKIDFDRPLLTYFYV